MKHAYFASITPFILACSLTLPCFPILTWGKYIFLKAHFITRTLFPVVSRRYFRLVFPSKPYHFDAVLLLIYIVSMLVYSNCTQAYLLKKIMTHCNFSRIASIFPIRCIVCSEFTLVFAYAFPILYNILQKQAADTECLFPLHFQKIVQLLHAIKHLRYLLIMILLLHLLQLCLYLLLNKKTVYFSLTKHFDTSSIALVPL